MTSDPGPLPDPNAAAARRRVTQPERFVEDRVEEAAARVADVVRLRSGPRFQWPLTLVLVGLVASLMIVADDHFRRGSVLFTASVGLALVLRLVLSENEAGWLAVRSRRMDVAVLASLTVSLSIFSLIVPPPS